MRGRLRLTAALFVCAFVGGASAAFAVTRPIPPSNGWPQASSDVPADPSITFGMLPNGMRYLIRRNTNPVGGVSLRFRIAVGSLQESDSEEGTAHFLEHMAFRGTKHVPDGEAIKMLESMGVSLQADMNAMTSPNSTVFMFDLPKNDDTTLDKGLLLLRDIASEQMFDPKAVDSERAVVLAEARHRDVAQMHGAKVDLSAMLGPRLADAMLPIGKTAVIQSETPDQLRKFYKQNYRPERATLIIVGDIDSKAVETKIKQSFSDWRDATPPAKPQIHPLPSAAGPRFTTFTEPGASAAIDLTWGTPYDATPDTVVRERRDIVRLIGLTVLNRRLQKLAHLDKPPFIGATASHNQPNNVADLTSLAASYAPGNAGETLRALHGAYAGIVRDGVQPDELAQAVSSLRAYFQTAVAAANSTPSPSWAGGYLTDLGRNVVICSQEENLILFEDAVKDLSADQVTASLRTLFTERGPSVFVSSPNPIEGGEAALAAAFEAPSAAAAVTPASAGTTAWPYTSFGPAGAIAFQTPVVDLGLTQVTFANGVRATIKPTKFRGGQIIVSVRFGDGRLGLLKDRKAPTWALNASFVAGGLGRLGIDDMQKAFAGKIGGAQLGVEDDSYTFTGATRPEDFDTELQVLAAYMTDPAWRPQAFQQAQAAMSNALTQANASPDGVYALRLASAVRGGDPRWEAPTADEVHTARLEEVKALLQNALAKGPVEVAVVGDITVDDAVKGLRATFGALPKHYATPKPLAGDERFPAPSGLPVVLRHQGGKDQALAMIAWPTVGMFPDVQGQRTLRVLQLVISQRLFDTLRTQEGMTYTPKTSFAASLPTPSYGYIAFAADIPPAKIPSFYAAIAKTITNLKSAEIPPDELERARGPRVLDLEHAQQTNEYWSILLSDSQANPRRLDLIRTTISGMQRVTAADVLRAARTYLLDNKAWKLVVLSEGVSPAAP